MVTVDARPNVENEVEEARNGKSTRNVTTVLALRTPVSLGNASLSFRSSSFERQRQRNRERSEPDRPIRREGSPGPKGDHEASG